MAITIVSCFYYIPENQKRTIEEYLYWMNNFLKYVDHPMVFFSDGQIADEIEKFRLSQLPKVPFQLIRKPLEELKFGEKDWIDYWSLCCKEGANGAVNSPNVYRIWTNKLWFLSEVIEKNPFNTNTFYWCDAGCWRNEEIARTYGPSWALPEKEGFHVSWLDNFGSLTPEEILVKPNTVTLAAGLIGGSPKQILLVKDVYEKIYKKAKEINLTHINDQHILASALIILRKEVKGSVLAPKKEPEELYDRWLYMEWRKAMEPANDDLEGAYSYSYVLNHPRRS
jgi:hypothetical protein